MTSVFENVQVVMVNPSHGGNVGSAARAMKTMGMQNLVLVSPDNFPSELATARASGATDILDNVRVVDRFEEAVGDCRLVIGTSGRMRRIPWPLMDARTCGEVVAQEASQGKVAIVFGREARGLTNEELHQCHYHVHIPGNPEYSVLNISAAIQVLMYEIRMAVCGSESNGSESDGAQDEGVDDKGPVIPMDWVRWDAELAPHQAVADCVDHSLRVLEAVEYYNPKEPRQTKARLQRLVQRLRLDASEVQLLRGMLSAAEKAVK